MVGVAQKRKKTKKKKKKKKELQKLHMTITKLVYFPVITLKDCF